MGVGYAALVFILDLELTPGHGGVDEQQEKKQSEAGNDA